jgi:cell division protein FtsW
MARKLESDKILFGAVVVLVLFGALMVYSASAVMAAKFYGGSYYFVIRQLAFAVAGLAAMVTLMNFDYRGLQSPRLVFPAVAIELILLVGALLSPRSHNVHRWLQAGPVSFEPSEFSKLALVLFLAYFLNLRRNEINDLAHTLAPLVLVTGLTVAMVLKQPDLGTSLAILFVAGAMLYVAGLKLSYFGLALVAVIPAFYFMVYRVPYQWKRISAFLDPTKDLMGAGFQAMQAKIAVATGGISGVGLMDSTQKLFYLPEPHNDFIFGVIGEELGFVGTIVVVGLFAVILWRGLRAAYRCQDSFGRLLAVGLTALIVGQALVNMSVVLGLLPTKGIPLPFISYGGTSLVVDLVAVGVLLNVSQHAT